MSKHPKYLKVLKYLYDNQPRNIHYIELINIIYSDEIIKKYKNSIDKMVCKYMGKLNKKDYTAGAYNTIKDYCYSVGYYIRPNGINLLKEKGIIQ